MTMSVRSRHIYGAALALVIAGLGCNTQTVTTPTRTLDRPSDVALYCVDIEVPDCLPKLDPNADPEAYLDAYCAQTAIDYANDTPPSVTVLTLDECGQERRSLRNSSYLAAVYQAARLTGRDLNAPCCPADNPTCGQATPVCARRTISALIANTARGELAVADTESQTPGLSTRGRLENLHGGQPGFGFLPAGLQPEHVRSTAPPSSAQASGPAGRRESPAAWAVTSNAGSCDLSMVGLQKIAELSARPARCFQPNQICSSRNCTAESCPQRVEPWFPGPAGSAGRPLRARPSWVEIAPWSQVPGARRAALVAYPRCGLVAAVDLGAADATSCDRQQGCGRVLDAVAFDATGKPRVLSDAELATFECASDCGGDASAVLMPDPSALPDGGAPLVQSYPAVLAVEASSQRLLIGDSVGAALTVVDLDSSTGNGSHFRTSPRTVPLDFNVLPESLHGGQRGIQAIRVSPRTPAGQFAYLVARDSSVRVIDLDREVECETNPDPRYLQAHAGDIARVLPDELNESNLRRLSCFPVGSGAEKTPRSPLATGPGIILPNSSLPRDIGFVHVDTTGCDVTDSVNCDLSPQAPFELWRRTQTNRWIGDFAWLLGGVGVVTGVQVADACPGPSYRACFPELAALRRVSFLQTRSQFQPNPEIENLPALHQALMVTPSDRLMNVRRIYSRFEDTGPFGPLTDSDAKGLPVFTASVNGTAVAYLQTLTDSAVANGRPRLVQAAPAPYYYLPVDPVCDVALANQALPANFSSPTGQLPPEPTRRPVSMMQFTNPQAVVDNVWTLTWEGALPGLARTTGSLLSDGTLVDLNGLYCSRGVESGDKLWLSGCQTDADCLPGSICQRESNQGTAPGLCLTSAQRQACYDESRRLIADKGNDTVWAATWLRRYRVLKAEQQVATASGDTQDRLTLDEIAEPEFELERRACTTLGSQCPATPIALPGRTVDAERLPPLTCRATGKTAAGSLDLSCILECKSNLDCGVGFVCAHSHYEAAEAATWPEARTRPRCMRAPLFDDKAIRACFPDPIRYEVRGGDAFVVSGDRSGAPSLVQRQADGSCQRPPKGSASFATSRLLEPRLRLGPRDSVGDTDKQRCSRDLKDWILHRVPPSPEALAQPSCQKVRNVGQVQLQGPLNGTLAVVHGQDFPLQGAADPWLASEYELFSSLPLADERNQCLLTGLSEEEYPSATAIKDCYEVAGTPGKICRFPGDHTESLGVRRIHYENAYANLVLRLPRVLLDPSKPSSAVWAVPTDGYSVSFTIRGPLRTYELPVQTTQRDVSSGLLAQGLRSATAAPSGVLFVVDEGRTGTTSGLRGQVLRLVGSQVDPVFLLR